jgi:hypothetical protein
MRFMNMLAISLFLFYIIVFPGYADPVAYWHLDGTLNDSINQHGINLFDDTDYTTNGNSIWGLSFDGDGDYASAKDFGKPNETDMSIVIDYKFNEIDDNQYIFSFTQDWTVDENVKAYGMSDGNIDILSDLGMACYNCMAYTPDTWYQIAIVIDSGNKVEVFLNGTSIVNDTSISETFRFDDLYIGGAYGGNDFNGSIDNICLYNKTLSDDEIKDFANGVPCYGHRNIYFDTSGSDSNPCNSTHPCQSISKANSIMLTEGDKINFSHDDIWRTPETALDLQGNGTYDHPIIISGGNFYGSYIMDGVGNWTDQGGNIWKSSITFSDDIGSIWDGNTQVGLKEWNNTDTDTQDDYYYNQTDDYVYYYSTTNPYTLYGDLELAFKNEVVQNGHVEHRVYQDMQIMYGASHGFSGAWVNDITLANSNVTYGGGARHTSDAYRFGNAVQFGLNTTRINVSHCIVKEWFDAGLSFQAWSASTYVCNMSDHYYGYNIVDKCDYNFEYFNSNTTHSSTHNITLSHNTFLNAGRGWATTQNEQKDEKTLRLYKNPEDSTGWVIKDNIIANSSYNELELGWGGYWYGDAPEIDYNLWVKGGSYFVVWNASYSGSPEDLSELQTLTGQNTNGVEADPLFYPGTYYLYADSPACGAASDGSDIGALPCLLISYSGTSAIIDSGQQGLEGMSSMLPLLALCVIGAVLVVALSRNEFGGEEFIENIVSISIAVVLISLFAIMLLGV